MQNFQNKSDHGTGIVFCLHLSNLCRDGIADAEKAKEKIKKKFGICKPDDVAKVCHVMLLLLAPLGALAGLDF